MSKKIALICTFCFSLSLVSLAQTFRKHVEKKDHRNLLTYAATFTKDTVYLNLKIQDELALTKILRWGFHIYFDVKGEKRRKRYFSYPLKRDIKNRWKNTEIQIPQLLKKLPNSAEITVWKNKEIIPLKYTNSGVKVNISYMPNDMHYDVQLPTQKLFDQKIETLEKLTIVFESNDFDMTKQVMEYGMPEGFAHFESLDPTIVIEKLSYRLKVDFNE